MPRVYTRADNKIVAPVGESFTIELEGNPTTGYEWELEFDNDKLKLMDRQYQPPDANAVGGGGKEQFKLKAIKKGDTVIRAIYKRAWERDPIEEKKFNVQLKT
jgi:inhibitor of cysteine peptidase